MVSWVINQSATGTDSTSFINALLNRSLSCLPCLESFFFPLSCFWIKKEISARQNCILSVFLKISIAETVICHPNSLSISDCFSFSFLQAGEGRRAALTTGSHEFFVPRLMERYSAAPLLSQSTRYPKMTPDPFVCLYQACGSENIVMSHSGCVFTLWSHARKEISHGLLKVARWGRMAAAHQSCSDLPLRGRIYLMSSPLLRPLTNTKQPP